MRRRSSPALWSYAPPIAAISCAIAFSRRLACGMVNFRCGRCVFLAMARVLIARKALRIDD
jgi:hypothetical protein